MTIEEFEKKYPGIYFVKTRIYINGMDNVPQSEMVFDEDIPAEKVKASKVIPLSIKSYPGILNCRTAMQAGLWAVEKCASEGWHPTRDNIECCLANLEMDF